MSPTGPNRLPACMPADHAAQLRLMLERSRLAGVERHAHARAVVMGLAAKLETSETQLSESQNMLSRTKDNLKLHMMELDGANAQLQVTAYSKTQEYPGSRYVPVAAIVATEKHYTAGTRIHIRLTSIVYSGIDSCLLLLCRLGAAT